MDVEFTTLTITGYGDEPVPNQLARQREKTTTLAVLLPGLGYTADMPLLYYAERTALERGWDVLRVDYRYRPLQPESSPDERRELGARMRADVDGAFAAGLQQRSYGRVVLIGKSLGTRAMEHLLGNGVRPEVWNVWLTPLINQVAIRSRIEAYPGRTFIAIGTEDFAYDAGYLEQFVKDDRFQIIVVGGADHSMDISGDIAGSIRAMGAVMSRLDAFLPDS